MKMSALFLMKLRVISKVSQTALDELISDVSFMLESRVLSLQEAKL